MLKIGLWKKEIGNLMSHSSGLSQEQVDQLKALKPGDRLIVWCIGTKQSEDHADYTIEVIPTK